MVRRYDRLSWFWSVDRLFGSGGWISLLIGLSSKSVEKEILFDLFLLLGFGRSSLYDLLARSFRSSHLQHSSSHCLSSLLQDLRLLHVLRFRSRQLPSHRLVTFLFSLKKKKKKKKKCCFSSMDRAASVLFPLSSRRFCHRQMAYSLTLVLVLILTLFNSHLFYGFVVLRVKSLSDVPLRICHHRMDSKAYRQFFSVYDSYVDVLKTNVIPFLVMSVCNLIIIVRVCRTTSSSSSSTSEVSGGEQRLRSTKSKRKHEKDRQLTLMLVSSAMAFLILTLPTEINDIIRSHSPGDLVNEKTYLLSAILLSLAHLNYAVRLNSVFSSLSSTPFRSISTFTLSPAKSFVNNW